MSFPEDGYLRLVLNVDMPENDAVELLEAMLSRLQAFPQLRSRCPHQDAGKDHPVAPTLRSVGSWAPAVTKMRFCAELCAVRGKVQKLSAPLESLPSLRAQ